MSASICIETVHDVSSVVAGVVLIFVVEGVWLH